MLETEHVTFFFFSLVLIKNSWSDIEKMVSVKGMIIRCSSIIPEIREAIFRCLICGYFSDPVVVDRGTVNYLYLLVDSDKIDGY